MRPLISKVWHWVRRRPWLSAAAVLLVALAGGWFAVNSWALGNYRAAQKALVAEKFTEARAHLGECLRVPWWQTADNYLMAARLERMLGNAAQARQFLQKSHSLRGQVIEASYVEDLLLRVEEGHFPQVEAQLQEMVAKKHTESPQILRTLAHQYIAEGQYDVAHGCLNAWLALNPSAAEALRLRSQVWIKFHNAAKAEDDIRRAVTLAPHVTEARVELIEVLMLGNGNLKDIVHHLDLVGAAWPDRPEYLLLLARCRMLQGNFPAARQILDDLVSADLPSPAQAFLCRAELELQDGHFAEAEKWARRASVKDSSNYLIYNVLAESLKRQDDPKKAEEAAVHHKKFMTAKADMDRLNQLLNGIHGQANNDPNDLAEIGDILWRNGKEYEGLSFLRLALARDKNHPPAHASLGRYYTKKNQLKKAAEHEKLARAAPPK